MGGLDGRQMPWTVRDPMTVPFSGRFERRAYHGPAVSHDITDAPVPSAGALGIVAFD